MSHTSLYTEGGPKVVVGTGPYEFIRLEDTYVHFRTEGTLKAIFAALQSHFADQRVCEFCDNLSTTTEQDELGNDCDCCENHAQILAAKKPERIADERVKDE